MSWAKAVKQKTAIAKKDLCMIKSFLLMLKNAAKGRPRGQVQKRSPREKEG
jgi:hypothetical protein